MKLLLFILLVTIFASSEYFVNLPDAVGEESHSGTVSFGRTIYPIPWGTPDDFGLPGPLPDGRSIFPIHSTGITGNIDEKSEFLPQGDVIVKIRVNDPDFNLSPNKIDSIAQDISNEPGVGLVKIGISRGADKIVLGYAGGTVSNKGKIDIFPLADVLQEKVKIRQLGPMKETHQDSGIFELKLALKYTDGPVDRLCPLTTSYDELFGNKKVVAYERFDNVHGPQTQNCILQGDTITVEYTDPVSGTGEPTLVTDSARFDLRNGVIQSDRSIYNFGHKVTFTLIDPDLNLDIDVVDTFNLDLIEWNSHVATLTMGERGGETFSFDPIPLYLQETGKNTNIFQTIFQVPTSLYGNNLERGEEIVLQYTDWGSSGSDFVGDKDEDVNLSIFTSNLGATVELDQKVYTWTDKVYITVVAPDHNFDSDLIEEIGNTDLDPIKISTSGKFLDKYKLMETNTDTGIFTGEVILTGFCHNADGKLYTGVKVGSESICAQGDDTDPRTTPKTGGGPIDGFLETSNDDDISVSFEFYEGENVEGSSIIRWNIGEIQWLDSSYSSLGTGIVRVVDPDMNLDPEDFDNFQIRVISQSEPEGAIFTVHETNQATGIFEASVRFSEEQTFHSSQLKVSEGDIIVAKYVDRTLPDPYELGEVLVVNGTAVIDIPKQLGQETKNEDSFFYYIIAGTDSLPLKAGETKDVPVTIFRTSDITKTLEIKCSVSPSDFIGCKVSPSIVEPDPKVDVKVIVDTLESITTGIYTVTITSNVIDDPMQEANSDNFLVIVEGEEEMSEVTSKYSNELLDEKSQSATSSTTNNWDGTQIIIGGIIAVAAVVGVLIRLGIIPTRKKSSN